MILTRERGKKKFSLLLPSLSPFSSSLLPCCISSSELIRWRLSALLLPLCCAAVRQESFLFHPLFFQPFFSRGRPASGSKAKRERDREKGAGEDFQKGKRKKKPKKDVIFKPTQRKGFPLFFQALRPLCLQKIRNPSLEREEGGGKGHRGGNWHFLTSSSSSSAFPTGIIEKREGEGKGRRASSISPFRTPPKGEIGMILLVFFFIRKCSLNSRNVLGEHFRIYRRPFRFPLVERPLRNIPFFPSL